MRCVVIQAISHLNFIKIHQQDLEISKFEHRPTTKNYGTDGPAGCWVSVLLSEGDKPFICESFYSSRRSIKRMHSRSPSHLFQLVWIADVLAAVLLFEQQVSESCSTSHYSPSRAIPLIPALQAISFKSDDRKKYDWKTTLEAIKSFDPRARPNHPPTDFTLREKAPNGCILALRVKLRTIKGRKIEPMFRLTRRAKCPGTGMSSRPWTVNLVTAGGTRRASFPERHLQFLWNFRKFAFQKIFKSP